MYIYPAATISLLFLCSTVITHGSSKPAHLPGDISVNCGSTVNSAAVNGREWLGEAQPQSSSILEIGGSSTTSTVIHNKLIAADNAVPYTTARISRSQFSYAFRVSPGQKILLLHFNPVPYKGFKEFKDLFTVEAGSFTLLGNFSASLAAQAFGVKSFVKEFCLYVHENQQLNIMFSPSDTSPFLNVYAFINGIEIISVPPSLSYFHDGDTGSVQVVGHKSLGYADYNTALELVHRLSIRQSSHPSNGGDSDHMFPVWVIHKANKVNNGTWRIPVDVGFRYLIRLHFTELGVKTMTSDDLIFQVFINEMIAQTNVDIGKTREGNSIPWHVDYMVVVRGHKKLRKRDAVISLHPYDKLVDRDWIRMLDGFEVFKLSNHDDSLAGTNPLPLAQAKPDPTIKTLLRFLSYRYATANVLIMLLSLVNVIGHKSRVFWEIRTTKEENKPSDRAQKLCRLFSLSEIRSATRNFSDGLLLGRGGFGKVYKGTIDNGATTVAVKRLKPDSSQGAHEFMNEIETLSKVRHYNLVSLLGYCNEQGEMILVYDYMAGGTVADHLYKLPRESINFSFLTWKQRLDICIGAARGLDYLHMGIGVIHRDVKTSNILLDENFVAKVSDFGLVKHEDISNLKSHVSTRVKGTRGYMDPYYMNTSKLTRKSDTYAFGVVLLEILCERPAVDFGLPEDEQILTGWARENINKGNIHQIVCSSMRDEVSEQSLRSFVAVAERCLYDKPQQRPTMGQVVLQLESVLELQNSKQVSGSTKVANVSDDNRDDLLVNKRMQTMVSKNFQNQKHRLREERNVEDFHAEISAGREDRGKATVYKPSRLGKWDVLWKRIEPSNKNNQLVIRGANVSALEYDNIVAYTNNFSHIVGRGGYASVYKGVLPSQLVVAVRRCSLIPEFVIEELINEILLLPNLKHRNIIKLLGYCFQGEERLIIYEFMENRSLDLHIGDPNLQWALRLEIIMGIAQGVLYLHQDSVKSVIIHRDLKCNNILLDAEMNPRISGFQWMRTLDDNQSHLTTLLAGTFGYISPEYFMENRCSVKSDVYSFGVIVLEIIAGKICFDFPSDEECTSYTDIAWRLWNEGRAIQLADESILGPFPVEEALRCIQVALLCIQEHPSDRPTMPHVVKMLEGSEPLSEPRAPRWVRSNQSDDSGSSNVHTGGLHNDGT